MVLLFQWLINIINKKKFNFTTKAINDSFAKAQLKFNLGKPFDSSNVFDVTPYFDSEVLDLIYIPVKIYSENHKRYYLVDENNILVAYGNVDNEGLKQTIVNDLVYFNDYMNLIVAKSKNDEIKVKEF